MTEKESGRIEKEAARNHTRSTDFKTNYYVDGNTVRRLEGEPEERRRRQLEKEQELRRRKHRHAAKRNQERAMQHESGICFVLHCCIDLNLCCCCDLYSVTVRNHRQDAPDFQIRNTGG